MNESNGQTSEEKKHEFSHHLGYSVPLLLCLASLSGVGHFSFWLRTAVLLCIGVAIGADNIKYSTDGANYGLAPYATRL